MGSEYVCVSFSLVLCPSCKLCPVVWAHSYWSNGMLENGIGIKVKGFISTKPNCECAYEIYIGVRIVLIYMYNQVGYIMC